MDIYEAIEDRRKQIKKLEDEIDALVFAAEIIKGDKKTETEKPKTQPDMAYAILEEVGKPMHVAQLAEQIKKKFSVTIKANNLSVMLFRYSKRGNRFYKSQDKPNTYGLNKWQEISERVQASKALHSVAS
ncbi:MAG: hypothetical protein WA639_07315 [Candidatus Acidiferrum sp.]